MQPVGPFQHHVAPTRRLDLDARLPHLVIKCAHAERNGLSLGQIGRHGLQHLHRLLVRRPGILGARRGRIEAQQQDQRSGSGGPTRGLMRVRSFGSCASGFHFDVRRLKSGQAFALAPPRDPARRPAGGSPGDATHACGADTVGRRNIGRRRRMTAVIVVRGIRMGVTAMGHLELVQRLNPGQLRRLGPWGQEHEKPCGQHNSQGVPRAATTLWSHFSLPVCPPSRS